MIPVEATMVGPIGQKIPGMGPKGVGPQLQPKPGGDVDTPRVPDNLKTARPRTLQPGAETRTAGAASQAAPASKTDPQTLSNLSPSKTEDGNGSVAQLEKGPAAARSFLDEFTIEGHANQTDLEEIASEIKHVEAQIEALESERAKEIANFDKQYKGDVPMKVLRDMEPRRQQRTRELNSLEGKLEVLTEHFKGLFDSDT